jgi:aminopeptidase N
MHRSPLTRHRSRTVGSLEADPDSGGPSLGLANGLQRGLAVDPDDPLDAQQIVAEYARVLDRDLQQGAFPAAVDSLPFSKPIIKTAIRTSVLALTSEGRMTEDLRDFLQTAFVSLADYVTADLARLLSDYNRAAAELAADPRLAREKTTGSAWQTISESSQLAGEIARSVTAEAEELRAEFSQLMV